MTYDDKVAWLRRYRQALRDEARLRYRIKAVRSRAESTTQALRLVVSGGSQDGTKIERGAELLDQYQRELQEQLPIMVLECYLHLWERIIEKK